jgi:hypothetical protein
MKLTRKEFKILLKSGEDVIVSSSDDDNIISLGLASAGDKLALVVELTDHEIDSLINVLQIFRKEQEVNRVFIAKEESNE